VKLSTVQKQALQRLGRREVLTHTSRPHVRLATLEALVRRGLAAWDESPNFRPTSILGINLIEECWKARITTSGRELLRQLYGTTGEDSE
jgi:hypothetical protein